MVSELIKQFDALGIKLWIDKGDRLHYKAPEGVMDKEKLALLKKNKTEIIEILAEDNRLNKLVSDTEHEFDVFPITDIQGAYLVGRNEAYDLGGVGCHGYVELSMPVMDKEKLERAFHKVISRHAMMRAIVLKNGVQKVLKNIEFPKLEYQDLRGFSESDAERELLAVREKLENKKYNPEEWPLYDFVLSNMDTRSVLHCSIDMLIADFVSVDIILKEMDFYYYNEMEELENLEISYRDVIIHQKLKEQTISGTMEKERDWRYWEEKIRDLPGKPEMTICTENSSLSNKFEKYCFELEKDKWNHICENAQLRNLTPSSVILSIFTDVIGLFSKSRRFCINLTQLKRPNIHPQINNIVGDFTSVEVLEVNTTGNFIERTHQLQQRLWNDLEHTSISGIEILRESGKKQNTNMIVPVVYTSTLGLYTDNGGNGEFMRDAKITYRISQTPQVWIDCQVSEYKEGLEINWDVREGIFPVGLINDAFEIFKNAILALSSNIDIWEYDSICKLTERMTNARKNANKTTIDIDSNGSLQDGFWFHVMSEPNRTAIIYEEEEYSYGSLGLYVQTIMHKLRELKCKEGDIVAVLQQKGIWQIASVLGILSINATYLPIDCTQPLERIKLIMEDAVVNYVILDARQNIDTEKCIINVDCLNIDKYYDNSTILSGNPKYPAYLIYTSGSTGIPKGVVIGHKAALNTIKDINRRFNINKEDKIISLAHLSFDLSVYDIFGMFDVGGTLIIPSAEKEKDPDHWVKLIDNYGITLWNTVPAMMQLLVAYLDSNRSHEMPTMRRVLLSGDWIPVSLPNNVKKYFPNATSVSLGGATEAGIWSIFYEINNVNIISQSIPYGKPLANQRFYILNDNMDDVPNLVTGKLYIGGDSLADEYYKSPELTKKKFTVYPITGERIYETGDIGRYLCDGNIEFQGRCDNQIKIRGHRIELSEIESVLNSHPQIQNSVALKTQKDKIAVFIEAKSRNRDVNKDDFKDIINVCYAAGDDFLGNVDRNLFQKWVELSDKTTLYEIMTVFCNAGIFTDKESLVGEEELRLKLKVQSKYFRLLKRWLNVLTEEEFIELVLPEKKYRRKLEYFNTEDTKFYRDEFEKTENELHYGAELYNYMKESSNHIAELLQGSIDPLALFFPEGKTDIALAAYNDNMVNHSLNNVVKAALNKLISKYLQTNGNKTVRILEIGAGVGGTTTDILPGLKGRNIEYCFTDISSFFINEARKKFSEYSFVTYGIYNINQDYNKQGLLASSWDIIISANVLHNSKNAPDVLQSLRELLLPNGVIIVIEATRESFSLLTSLEFKEGLTGFTDSRKGTDRTFFSREEWTKMFTEIGADVLCTYPRNDDPISLAGQSVFVVKMDSVKEKIEYLDIANYLKERLPSYMIPDYLEILPVFPVTGNGKIDRKKLLDRVVENEKKLSVEEKFDNLLEKEIADIWKEVLNIENVNRNENFYVAGGDSLLIAQVVTKIKEKILSASKLKWDVLMRLMLQNMTIEEFAKALVKEDDFIASEARKRDLEKSNSLVTFKEAKQQKNKAIVFFHAGTGTLTPYNKILGDILKRAGEDEGILGLCFGDEKEYLKQNSSTLIVDTARRYAKLLIEKNYKEFKLVGYCMGGWLAIETSRILMEYGFTVQKVITISTSLGSSKVDNDLLLEAAFANVAGARIDQKLGRLLQSAIEDILSSNDNTTISTQALCLLDGKYEVLGNYFRRLSELSEEERLNKIFESISEPQEDIVADNIRMLHIIYKLFSCNYKGVLSYKPEPYLGDVQALIVKDKSQHFFHLDIDNAEERMWEEIVLGNLEIRYIDGNHQTCLEGENIQNIVGIICEDEEDL